MAKVRDGNAADLSQRINVAFYTGQINRCLCNYWRGLQRISEASPPEDVTVGQVQRVGHSRLDPDCTSTDYGGAVIAWPRRCAHITFPVCTLSARRTPALHPKTTRSPEMAGDEVIPNSAPCCQRMAPFTVSIA